MHVEVLTGHSAPARWCDLAWGPMSTPALPETPQSQDEAPQVRVLAPAPTNAEAPGTSYAAIADDEATALNLLQLTKSATVKVDRAPGSPAEATPPSTTLPSASGAGGGAAPAGVRPIAPEVGPVKFCKQLTKSDIEQGLYIPTIESQVIRREARADPSQPVLLCVVEVGLDVMVRATKWGNYGGALKMTGRTWHDIVHATRLYVGRQLQVDVVGSFPAPKAALMDNPGSAPRTVVLSFKTLQIVHVTEDINVARDSNGGGGSETSSGIPRLVGTVTEAPTPGPRSVKRTRAAAQAAAPPPAPSTSEGTTDPAAAVRIAHLEARVASLEWCVSTMRDTIATLADGVLDKNALRARVGGAAGHMPPMHGDAMQGFPGQQGALPSPFNLPPSHPYMPRSSLPPPPSMMAQQGSWPMAPESPYFAPTVSPEMAAFLRSSRGPGTGPFQPL